MRIGLIIPRFKHSAVMRNQLKRRLRELARVQLIPLSISMDLVMRIRPDAYEATFSALAKDVGQVLEQLERWRVAALEDSSSNNAIVDRSHEE
jgi:ribonuclease P protein component